MRPRQKPINEYDELREALVELRDSIIDALYLDKITKWLNTKLEGMAKCVQNRRKKKPKK